MDLGFKDKTIIVTGGTKGIGGGISEVFAQEGGNLVIDYRSDPEGSEAFIQGLRDTYGVEAYGIQADVSEPESAARILDFAEEKFGRLDVVINNAGGAPDCPLTEVTLESWEKSFANNVTGQLLLSREFANRQIAEGKTGHIVNVLSKASVSTTTPGHGQYVVNKHAELGLVRQLAVELTSKGIYCVGIMPGSVMNQIFARCTPEQLEARAKRCPLGRLNTPIELANYVVFLASDKNMVAIGCGVDATAGMLLGY